MKINISGKTALVTGASRGIGKEVVRSLLEAGAFVIAISREKKNLDLLCQEFSPFKDRLEIISADFTSSRGTQDFCDVIIKKGIAPDIIINNAGVFRFTTLEQTTDSLLRETFEVNFFAPFLICQKFVPLMLEKKWGRIINICSSSAYTGGGTSGHCAYSASKHALLGFSRALDEEVRKQNIRIGTISPAGVRTDMLSDRTDLDQSTLMSPVDVAEAVMYLVTSDGPGIVYEMRLWRMLR